MWNPFINCTERYNVIVSGEILMPLKLIRIKKWGESNLQQYHEPLTLYIHGSSQKFPVKQFIDY